MPDDESKDTFEKLAYSLLEANTVSVFEIRRVDMNRFIKEREERKCLKTWVEWWDARKSHIFRAFNGTMYTPAMNYILHGQSQVPVT